MGGRGNDALYGGAGDDVFFQDGYGETGYDLIDGGAGHDIVRFDGMRDDYRIYATADGWVVSGPGGKHSVTGVEVLNFRDGDYDPLPIVCRTIQADKSAAIEPDSPLIQPATNGPGPSVLQTDPFAEDWSRSVGFTQLDIDLPDLALLPGERGRPATVAQDYDWIV